MSTGGAACRSPASGGASVRRRRRRALGLLENSEVTEQPPQNDEDQNGAETATAQLFCPVSGGDAAQQFAHDGLERDVERMSWPASAQTVPARRLPAGIASCHDHA